MKMPTLVGIFIFINREIFMPNLVGISIFISKESFMLSRVEHEKSFITSGPGSSLSTNRITGCYRMYKWRAKYWSIICACLKGRFRSARACLLDV